MLELRHIAAQLLKAGAGGRGVRQWRVRIILPVWGSYTNFGPIRLAAPAAKAGAQPSRMRLRSFSQIDP
jgi:hypothetical protein